MLREDFLIYQSETPEGVRVEIGASLMLLSLVMVVASPTLAAFLHNLAVLIVIIGSFHLREMARGWMVRLQGLELHGTVLSGAGGHTLHEGGSCRQEELIAIAGPLTSLALWAAANLLMAMVPATDGILWLEIFAFVNLFIALFTALPVMPLDGGRFWHLVLGRMFGTGFANRAIGGMGLVLSLIWLPVCLLAFLICGMILIAIPSVREHWDMLKGQDPMTD